MSTSSGVSPKINCVCSVLLVGAIISKISFVSVTGVAPCFIRALQPELRGLVIFPGTANTSLFWSSAWAAVDRVPERVAASTTTMPSAIPLTMRFLSKNLKGRGGVPGSYSLSIAPSFSTICFAKVWWFLGYIVSRPFARTAIVIPFASSAALWAILSMPSANPLITTTPALAKSPANLSVTSLPYCVGLREPTIAIVGMFFSGNFPKIYNFFGK